MILFELIKQESFILTALPRVEPPLWRFLKCFRMLMIRNTYIALKMTFFPKLMDNLHSRHGPLTHGFAVRQLGASTRTIKSKKIKVAFVFEIPKQSDTVDIYFRTLIQALLLCRHQSPDLISVFGRFAQIKGIVGHKTRNKHHPAKLEPSRLQSCPHWKA